MFNSFTLAVPICAVACLAALAAPLLAAPLGPGPTCTFEGVETRFVGGGSRTVPIGDLDVPAAFANATAGYDVINEVQKLLASDGAAGDAYGFSVSVSGNVAVVGASQDDDHGTNSGSAYVYRFDGSTWNREQKLLASDGALEDFYGVSVSVSGDVAVVGAHLDDDNGADSGSAYVYRFDGSTWNQEQKLLASDGASLDFYGLSVSVSTNVAVASGSFDDDNGTNSGSAYVYRFDGSSWNQEQKLLPSDGAAFDRHGDSVSVSGDVAVVGARYDDDNGTDSGSAYVYRFDGSTWNQEQKLLASDGAPEAQLGYSVSVSGNVAVVGAHHDDDNGQDSGSAYVYRFDGSTWNQEQKLLASDGASRDLYGLSVSVSGDVAVVGARDDDDNGTDSGSAYVYRFDGSSWNEEQKLLASDGQRGDWHGHSVSVSGGVAVVGAHHDDDSGRQSGSAYVYEIVVPCPEDLDGSGGVDLGDLFAVRAAWGNDGGPEDLDASGTVDFGDLLIVLYAWGPCVSLSV